VSVNVLKIEYFSLLGNHLDTGIGQAIKVFKQGAFTSACLRMQLGHPQLVINDFI
jgi:hypothetical protein